MNSVLVLVLLIHYYFGNINTSPIPAQPIQLLTNNGKILLKEQINAEINSTLSTFQNSLKNIFEKDYELDIWKNALTSSTAFFFTLIFAIVIYLRKKTYKKLIELEGKIEKMELKMKKKLLYLKAKLEPSQQSTSNV
jgi:hypothetical protein